jgi:hypothetical protein
MLWIDPDIYTLKDLLTVYPRAQLVSAREKRVVVYEEIEEASQREYGRAPTIEDVRWDTIYLRDPDGDVIPLSAGEMRLDEEKAELRNKVADLDCTLKELRSQLEQERAAWYLDIRFIAGFLVGLLAAATWSRLFGH